MTVDREYCMSSFLTYRTIQDPEYALCRLAAGAALFPAAAGQSACPCATARRWKTSCGAPHSEACKDGKAALALSGGIDSAALARFMPKGSTAYTFRCVVPGMQVTDESPGAARYAEACGLKHKIIDIYWEDFEALTPKLMKRKGMPVHSIEIQIYKAALQAKRDGFERLIFGETADVIYGGLDGLLSKDWLAGDFIERFAFVPAWKVLRDARLVVKPMLAYERDGHIDPHEFISQFFIREVVTSYFNACGCADIEATLPYLGTYLDAPLDYARVRGGENKYLVREMFRRLYPGFVAPKKLPMPRATNEWFRDWKGPTRPEFLPHCTDNMTGDQKWLVYCLEMFLNLLDTNFAGSAGWPGQRRSARSRRTPAPRAGGGCAAFRFGWGGRASAAVFGSASGWRFYDAANVRRFWALSFRGRRGFPFYRSRMSIRGGRTLEKGN